jgi:hypothetical protein
MICAGCGRLTWPGATPTCTEGDMRAVEVSNDWVTWKRLPAGEARKKYRFERTAWRQRLALVPGPPAPEVDLYKNSNSCTDAPAGAAERPVAGPH